MTCARFALAVGALFIPGYAPEEMRDYTRRELAKWCKIIKAL